MSVHRIRLEELTQGSKTAKPLVMYIRFTDDNTLAFEGVTQLKVFRGGLAKAFIEPEEGETVESTIRKAFTISDEDHVFEFRSDGTNSKGHISIKKKLQGKKELLRLADLSLEESTSSSVAESLSALLEAAITERNEREIQLGIESKLLESEKRKSDAYIAHVVDKASERDVVQSELMNRFLPILNAKKEKIRELINRIHYLESGQDKAEETVARSDDEAEADEAKPSRAKGRGRPTTASKTAKQNGKADSKNDKTKARSQEEDAEAPSKKKVKQTADLSHPAEAENEPEGRLTRSSSRTRKSASQDDGTSSDLAAKTSNEKSSKTAKGPLTEDEFGPLPPGWEVTTSRTTGKLCYQNKALKKKQYARPKFDDPADNPTQPEKVKTDSNSTSALSNKEASHLEAKAKVRKQSPRASQLYDDDEPGDKIFRDFL